MSYKKALEFLNSMDDLVFQLVDVMEIETTTANIVDNENIYTLKINENLYDLSILKSTSSDLAEVEFQPSYAKDVTNKIFKNSVIIDNFTINKKDIETDEPIGNLNKLLHFLANRRSNAKSFELVNFVDGDYMVGESEPITVVSQYKVNDEPFVTPFVPSVIFREANFETIDLNLNEINNNLANATSENQKKYFQSTKEESKKVLVQAMKENYTLPKQFEDLKEKGVSFYKMAELNTLANKSDKKEFFLKKLNKYSSNTVDEMVYGLIYSDNILKNFCKNLETPVKKNKVNRPQ